MKDKIANVSRELFNSFGYSKVTMRQIAAACDISVGNLTYYYPRKEDLLMLEHDGILNDFLNEVLNGDSHLSGLHGYFAVESAFLHRILYDPPLARLYLDVINVPLLRSRYCRAHHKLMQHFINDVPDDGPEWAATVAMCGLEFELADEVVLVNDFPFYMENVFKTRMLFSKQEPERFVAIIRAGISDGIQLSSKLLQH